LSVVEKQENIFYISFFLNNKTDWKSDCNLDVFVDYLIIDFNLSMERERERKKNLNKKSTTSIN